MSRSIKGSKGPGFDYWSRRPYNSDGYGKDVKKWTIRRERRDGNARVRQGETVTRQWDK